MTFLREARRGRRWSNGEADHFDGKCRPNARFFRTRKSPDRRASTAGSAGCCCLADSLQHGGGGPRFSRGSSRIPVGDDRGGLDERRQWVQCDAFDRRTALPSGSFGIDPFPVPNPISLDHDADLSAYVGSYGVQLTTVPTTSQRAAARCSGARGLGTRTLMRRRSRSGSRFRSLRLRTASPSDSVTIRFTPPESGRLPPVDPQKLSNAIYRD